MPRIEFLAALFILILLAPGAFADTLRVPGEHDTIQAAVDAAVAGDRIVVKRGVWAEHVVIAGKTGLELIGKGKPRVDGEDSGIALTISNSSDISVKGFVFERGAPHCVLVDGGSRDVTVSRCTVRNAADRGIRVVESDAVAIVKNRVEDVFDHCVDLRDSDDCLVRANRLRRSDEGDGVAINGGTRNEVSKNKVSECGDHGIAMDGPGNLAEKNRVSALGLSGIIARAAGNTARKNKIKDAADYGIALFSTGNVAEKNTVKKAQKDGVRIEGGTGNRVEKCTIKKSMGDGIRVVGGGNSVLDCKSKKNGGADISSNLPETANTYSGNKAGTTEFSSP